MRTLLVVAPFPSELPRLRNGAQLRAVGRRPYHEGSWPELPGDGPVIITGSCGALGEGVERGDLVLPSELHKGERGAQHPNPALRRALLSAVRAKGLMAHEGVLAGASELVDVASGKAAPDSAEGSGFCDMESFELARAAEAAGRPWAVLRFVSDTPAHPLTWLPAFFGGLPEEEPSARATLVRLLRRPWCLRRLVGLGLVTRRGTAHVAAVLRDVAPEGDLAEAI